MKFGVALESFTLPGKKTDVSRITEMAVTADSLAFDSIWVWDHLLLGSKNVFPVLEPLTLLAFLSAKTKRTALGISTLVLPLRDPVVLAKELQTLNCVSGSRLILGVSAGWYEKEFAATGKSYSHRGKATEEYLEILGMLLSQADVNGVFGERSFVHTTMEPRVENKFPILMGGYKDKVLKRIAEKSDGWISSYYAPEDFKAAWSSILSLAKEAGRDKNALTNINIVPICVNDDYDAAEKTVRDFTSKYMDLPAWGASKIESGVKGSVKECIKQIERYRENGVECLEFIPCFYDIEQVEIIGKEILPHFIK